MALNLFTVIELGAVGLFAGWLGALVGIGGGIIIVPVLVLLFGVDIKIAVATSLIAVVATSTAAGSVYVGKGLANMRLGMTLEIATTVGGISGGLLAVYVSGKILSALFAVMMLVTTALTWRARDPGKAKPERSEKATAGEVEQMGREEIGALAGAYHDPHHKELIHYEAHRIPMGLGISYLAGILSGMLGVGGGFLKVPAMNLAMKVPIKVAAATSNFMIGVTAISSLFVYFARGFVHPLLATPLVIGVVGGAFSGTAISHRVSPNLIRYILMVVFLVVAVEMGLKSVGVSLGR